MVLATVAQNPPGGGPTDSAVAWPVAVWMGIFELGDREQHRLLHRRLWCLWSCTTHNLD
jgi:hypothetical protein